MSAFGITHVFLCDGHLIHIRELKLRIDLEPLFSERQTKHGASMLGKYESPTITLDQPQPAQKGNDINRRLRLMRRTA